MTENTLLIGLVVFIIVLILTKSGNKCENMQENFPPSRDGGSFIKVNHGYLKYARKHFYIDNLVTEAPVEIPNFNVNAGIVADGKWSGTEVLR